MRLLPVPVLTRTRVSPKWCAKNRVRISMSPDGDVNVTASPGATLEACTWARSFVSASWSLESSTATKELPLVLFCIVIYLRKPRFCRVDLLFPPLFHVQLGWRRFLSFLYFLRILRSLVELSYLGCLAITSHYFPEQHVRCPLSMFFSLYVSHTMNIFEYCFQNLNSHTSDGVHMPDQAIYSSSQIQKLWLQQFSSW